ncbi:MAG TPA: DegT/DnrJ/EryC1/StrS family aminotransferase [Alphaproteobacteria bacterium]|nr:DegT/DnrJ/EryC1/StrS family aminotransferase [Alphaproteobacteria bacterium]
MARNNPDNVTPLRTGVAARNILSTAPADDQHIPFIDLLAQRQRLGRRIEEAIARVLDHGRFVAGPEIDQLEDQLSEWCGAKYSISCASGTTALSLGLSALGAKYRDAVFVPAFTFVSPAEVIARLGCVPVLVDVQPDSFNIDPESLVRGIQMAEEHGLTPRGIIAIDLFGQPADYPALQKIATAHDLWLMADAAQSFGAKLQGKSVGKLTKLTATSFFPSKPLGCYGDGGAIFTDSEEIAKEVRSRRQHGQGEDRMTHVRIGMNGRLDTVQAAILLEKLAILKDELEARDRIAARYSQGLKDIVSVPPIMPGRTSAWAQYTVRLRQGERDQVRDSLEKEGIPTAIYYHTALHHHAPYTGYPRADGGLPVSEKLARTVLSLPMHPYLEPDLQDRIIERFRAALAEARGG